MNEAEIARIVGGRSKWETLKASVNKWSLDPSKANSITPEQRQEVKALAATVTERTQELIGILTNARSALAGAGSPDEHRRILSDVINRVTAAAGAQSRQAVGQVPEITDQASYDKLPKGAHYTNGGVEYLKQ
jgi:hypothetical protein